MKYRVFAGLLSAMTISSVLCEATLAAPTHKSATQSRVVSKAHRTAARTGRPRHYRSAALIPPPPAYMPCVLPELYYRGTASGVTEIATTAGEKKENPYAQYVKSAAGDAPEALASRKGVVTWSARR